MKNQKGFTQIPLLIGIIVSIVAMSVITTSAVLYKQGKLASLTANISEIFKGGEEPAIIDSKKETEPPESQIEKEQDVSQESNQEKEVIKEVPVEEKIIEKPAGEKIVGIEEEARLHSQTQPEPVIEEKIKENFVKDSGSEFGGKIHDYFPIILSFSAKPKPPGPLKIGDEIHLKVDAYDPKDRQILYDWWCRTCSLNKEGWVTNNEVRYKITTEDVKSSGESLRIGVYIKSEKEYFRTGSFGYDDGIYTDYKISFLHQEELQQQIEQWISPVGAIASGYTQWGETWYTGSPEFAIDSNNITAWTLNDMGEITFDLGSTKTVKGIEAYWGGSVTNGNTVNIFVDDTRVLYNEQFGATSNKRYFDSIQGRYIKYQTVPLPHNVYLQVATWSEIAEFKVLVETD